MEQILATLTAPVVDIRYDVVDYRGGQVGKLEVLRDPKKLPYMVAKEVIGAGNRKRLTEGQIFVRHGSQAEEPTPAELLSLQEEGARARSI
jgi:hypothetical protein